MLAFNTEEPSTPDYGVLDGSIKETLTAIDRFEFQAISEIAVMRDEQLYLEAGYKTFQQYCANELTAWGGYRRINQLLGASRVKEVAEELGEHIKNERQARPLVRLADEPEKLKEAIALAVQENPSPSQADFAKAANNVVPKPPRKKRVQEPMVSIKATVTVIEESHPRYGQQGTIDKDPPNDSQQLVSFDDGEELLINNDDLDAPSVPFSTTQRTVSADEHNQAIADLERQYKLEKQNLEQELRIRLVVEAREIAQQQVTQEVQATRELYLQEKQEKIKWKQLADELEGLRRLDLENQQLKERIQELENDKARPAQDWGNTMTKQAAKVVNKELERAYKQTIDLRSLAIEPPRENAQECLRLMGMALSNLAAAMNNTQALEAAALILGSEATVEAIAHRAEQLQMLPQAISEIREVLATPGSTWGEFLAVAEKYQDIKKDFWAELNPQEKELINSLKQAFDKADVPPEPINSISIGSIVSHADPYCTLYSARGKVIQDLGDEVIVAWDHWAQQGKKTDRYFKTELRLYQGDNN